LTETGDALDTEAGNTVRQLTIHTRQLQQYTRSTNNNYTQDNLKLATTHTRQLQQYTRSTNNNYIQDNLKLATIHTRQLQ